MKTFTEFYFLLLLKVCHVVMAILLPLRLTGFKVRFSTNALYPFSTNALYPFSQTAGDGVSDELAESDADKRRHVPPRVRGMRAGRDEQQGRSGALHPP